MVVPEEVTNAVRAGRLDTVRDWLENGDNDVNDTEDGPNEWSLLYRCCMCFPVTEGHVAVAEYLLSRGADVNYRDTDGTNSLHVAVVRSSRIVELLLGAGIQVNARDNFDTNRTDATPIAWAINNLSSDISMLELKQLLECCVMLLRAGASLDAIGCLNPGGGALKPVEDFVDRQLERRPELATNEDLVAFQTIIADLRAAGGSWRQYVLAPPKALLRLRSLIARGRAREVRRLRARTPRPSAWLMSPRVPNEIAWRVLEYWNPRC